MPKSTGQLGTEAIQKATVQISEIVSDVLDATKEDSAGGKKITWAEGVSLVISDAGKVVKLVNAAGDILAEVKDLETKEAPEVVAAFKQIYNPENPFVETFAVKVIECIIAGKEAGEQFVLLKKWEKDN